MSDGLVLHPSGRLDLENSALFRQKLAHAFASGVRHVVVELADVVDLDLTGIGVLAGAARHLDAQGGGLVLRGPSAPVASVLRVNGLGALVEPAPAKLSLLSAG